MVNQRFIDPLSVTGFHIIATKKLVHPQGNYLADAFSSAIRFDGAIDVTYEFITTPPEEIAEKVTREEKVIIESNKVFIVHGHDDPSKNELAIFLYRLGLTPIVLHEQANEGKTIIEKFEQYASDVGYAFGLLTPDDVDGKGEELLKPRTRQNVVLELGYFMGKLGHNKVCS